MDQTDGYYYEHTNGGVHWKPRVVVDSAGGPREYFDSPFVARWWRASDERPRELRAQPDSTDGAIA